MPKSSIELEKNLWQGTAKEVLNAPPLESDASTDLVIIGGGFSGCSAALHAAEHGLDVVLLEAHTIGHGGSGRNVGLVNAGLWTPPEEVTTILGTTHATKLNTELAAAPELVFSLIQKYAIQCDPTRTGTLHCAHSAAGFKDLQNRYRQLKAQDAPVSLLNKIETGERTGSHIFHGALHDARAGTIQPLSYCRGLARAAKAMGAKLYEGSTALSISRNESQWVVKTSKATIQANSLLLATNGYHEKVSGIDSPSAIPVHYFQMATRPLSDDLLETILPAGEGCWDTAPVMSSFRRDAAGRILIGGIGALDHVGSNIHRAWAPRKLAKIYPQLASQPLEWEWFGRIAMTSDHIPKILQLGKNAYSLYGYSGRGIGPGTTFGKAIATSIATGDTKFLPLKPINEYKESLTLTKQIFYEAGATLTHLTASR